MSAYIVSDETINAMVAYFRHATRDDRLGREFAGLEACRDMAGATGDELWTMLGRKLRELNEFAIAERYGAEAIDEFTGGEPYTFRRMLPPPLPKVYGYLQCFRYQCAEGRAYTTELYEALTKVYHSMAHELVRTLAARADVEIPWGA